MEGTAPPAGTQSTGWPNWLTTAETVGLLEPMGGGATGTGAGSLATADPEGHSRVKPSESLYLLTDESRAVNLMKKS
jgi:hypothetical protein